jgi:hypothetical protein
MQETAGTRGLAGIGFASFRNWEGQSTQNWTLHYQIPVLENNQQHCCCRAEGYILELHPKQYDAPKCIAGCTFRFHKRTLSDGQLLRTVLNGLIKIKFCFWRKKFQNFPPWTCLMTYLLHPFYFETHNTSFPNEVAVLCAQCAAPRWRCNIFTNIFAAFVTVCMSKVVRVNDGMNGWVNGCYWHGAAIGTQLALRSAWQAVNLPPQMPHTAQTVATATTTVANSFLNLYTSWGRKNVQSNWGLHWAVPVTVTLPRFKGAYELSLWRKKCHQAGTAVFACDTRVGRYLVKML